MQNVLRKAARLEPSIALGLLATLPAVANVPAIWTNAANLQAGAGGRLDAFRTNVQWVAGHVDNIGDGFAVYWVAAAKIAQSTYLRLLSLRTLALAPQTKLAARVAMRATAAQANASLAAASGQLQRFLGSLGLKDVLSAVAAGIGGTAATQLAFMRPEGAARIDFGEAAIDRSKAATFTDPGQGQRSPAATRSFDWQVKTSDGEMSLEDVVKNQS